MLLWTPTLSIYHFLLELRNREAKRLLEEGEKEFAAAKHPDPFVRRELIVLVG